MTVPKIIHQTWETEDVPDKWKEGPVSIKKLNPGWRYILWTDAMRRKLIEDHYSWFLSVYDGYPYNIQRADSWRYFALYHYGGIYLDLDFIAHRSFDDLFENGCEADLYLINSVNYSCITNSIMASVPSCRFWPLVWGKMKDRSVKTSVLGWVSKHYRVMTTTGPVVVNDAFKEYSGSTCFFPTCSILDKDACSCLKKCADSDEPFLTTLPGKSWHAWDSTLVDFVYCNAKILLIFLGVLFGVIVTYFFTRLYSCKTKLGDCQKSCKII